MTGAGSRKLLDGENKKKDKFKKPDHHDDHEGEDHHGKSPISPIAPAPNGGIGGCVIYLNSIPVPFPKCYNLGGGTVYFTLSGSNVTIGYQKASPGWAALAIGRPHRGAIGVWTENCLGTPTCVNAFEFIQNTGFNPPSAYPQGPITNIQASKTSSGGAYVFAASFVYPIPPGASRLKLTLAAGNSPSQRHRGTPRTFTISIAALV